MVRNYKYPRQGSAADKEHVWEIIAKLEEKNKTDGSEVRQFIDENGFASFAEDFSRSSRKKRYSTPPGSLERELVLLLADLVKWSCDKDNLPLVNNLMYLLGYLSYDSKPLRFRQKIENMKKKVRGELGSDFGNFSSTLYRTLFSSNVDGSNTLVPVELRPGIEGELPTLPTANPIPPYQGYSDLDHTTEEVHDKEITTAEVTDIGEIPDIYFDIEQPTLPGVFFNVYDDGANPDVLDDLPPRDPLPELQEYFLGEGNVFTPTPTPPTPTPSTTQPSRGISNNGTIALPGVPKDAMMIPNMDFHIQLLSTPTPSNNCWEW